MTSSTWNRLSFKRGAEKRALTISPSPKKEQATDSQHPFPRIVYPRITQNATPDIPMPAATPTGQTARPWQGRKKWSAPARMPNRSGRRPDGSVERTGCGGSRSTTAAWSTTRRGISRGPGPGAGPWRTWRQPERTCSAISQRNRRIWSAHTTGRRSPGTRRSSSACTMN